MENKKVVILGGGTVSHVRNHLALAAPAYGQTARKLASLCKAHSDKLDVKLILTRMAQGEPQLGDWWLEDTDSISRFVDEILIPDKSVKIVFFNLAMVDFHGFVLTKHGEVTESGKYEERLKTRDSADGLHMILKPEEKIISKIRKERKDIFLVGFKTTCGAEPQQQFLEGLRLLKESSCNLVLANDTKTRRNMVITPEEAAYHDGEDRQAALKGLVDMAYLRSHLTFTRSTVVDGKPVPWTSKEVPETLRTVVNFCIESNAYKPFRGATVGHFAVKLDDQTFLTSRRKTNFNELYSIGLVKVKTDGPDSVIAFGSKPSVGGQSQRIVFSEHGMDCIVHFHCPLKADHKDDVPVVSQREYECGSHECGKNTSRGLKQFGNLKAVMLDKHGPNIVFSSDIDPKEVIDFVQRNFDLSGKTGGYVLQN